MTRQQMEDKINNLNDKVSMYENFIIKHNGRPALDRLNLEFAIQHTKDFEEIRTMADFEDALMRGLI